MQRDHHATEEQATGAMDCSFRPLLLATGDQLPDVPAMSVTRLQLELLLQESVIDLSAVADVILSDLGATLQIFRLVGEDYPEDDGRPTRIEDCIVSLGLERWYQGVCSSSIPYSSPLSLEWQQCRSVGQCAKELAECVSGFSPEEAYIVGLLFELGRLPYLLGWNLHGSSPLEHRALGVMLADYWHLPEYLASAIREQQDPHPDSRWTEMILIARQAASRLDAARAD